MIRFVLSVIVCLATFVAVDRADAQQCNVQSNNAVSASSAAQIQQQAALIQQLQLQALNAQRATSAVSSVAAPVQAPLAVRTVYVQAPLALSAPVGATTSATATAGVVAAPAPTLTPLQLQALQLSALSAPVQAVAVGNGGSCSTSRSSVVSRAVQAVGSLRPQRSTSRSVSRSVSRSG